jgi:hypothetical protein
MGPLNIPVARARILVIGDIILDIANVELDT